MEYRGEQSTFNEGAGQMERINILQIQINNCWVAPLRLDIGDKGSGRYGYQIIFSNYNSLLGEVSSKLTTTELEDIKKDKENLRKLFECNPIHIIRWNDTLAGRKKISYINQEGWNKIEGALFDYGLKIRKLLEEHNMTSPKQKDPSKAIFGN